MNSSFRRRGGFGGFGGFGPGGLEPLPNSGPSELYPQMIVPVQEAGTEFERKSAAQILAFKRDIKDGPLYIGPKPSKGRGKAVASTSSTLQPGIGDGIKRYSDRYIKKIKIGKSLDEHKYVLKFFPEELHATMAGKNDKKRKLDISRFTSGLLEADALADKETIIDKLNVANEEEDGDEEKEPGAESDQEIDDDFEEDEDEYDDYNAERYFDGGDEMNDYDDGDDEGAM